MPTGLQVLLRHMPTGLKDFLRHVPTGLKDLLRHVPTGLKDLLRHVPTGLKDLWATRNVKVRNAEFLYETSFDDPVIGRSWRTSIPSPSCLELRITYGSQQSFGHVDVSNVMNAWAFFQLHLGYEVGL